MVPVPSPLLKVCYFGTYRANYSRNRIMIGGLESQDVEVFICHVPMWQGIEDRVEQVGGGWRQPRFWWRVVKTYWQLYRQHSQIPEYDVMILGYPGQFDAYLGRLLSWWRRKPMVLDLYMSLYLIAEERGLVTKNSITGRLIILLEAVGLRLVDLLISDTEVYASYHCQTYGLSRNRFRIIPAGADDLIFYPRPELKPPDDIFQLIYHGTFIPNHDVPTMIRAMALLRSDPTIRLDLYGDGPERSSTEDLAQELELENVQFHGWIDKEKLPEKIARSHLCLGAFGITKTSRSTIQNKIWESMFVARPVITGDAPTIRSSIRDRKEVYLVERTNPHELVSGIIELKKKPTLRKEIAEAGFARSRQNTPDALGRIFRQVIESIIS